MSLDRYFHTTDHAAIAALTSLTQPLQEDNHDRTDNSGNRDRRASLAGGAMTAISELPQREPSVRALWTVYLDARDRAAIARSELEAWPARSRALQALIEKNDAASREAMDILSQIGEPVGRVPEREDLG